MNTSTNSSATAIARASSHLTSNALLRWVTEHLYWEWHNGIGGWRIAATILAILVAYDQVMYLTRKGSIPGPIFKIPFMGSFVQALNPKFEAYEAQWASGAISCVSVFHKFVVLASERDIARKVFNSTAHVKPCLVPIAEKIMGSSAWVFLDGKRHVDFRRGLNVLFTRKALQCYLPIQEKVWSEYFNKFVAASKENGGKPIPFMSNFREINCALSCRTFVGDYISDEAVKKIADDYYCITAALELVNIPLSMYVPYTKVWLGKRAADGVLAEFTKCAAASKLNMTAGREPTCTIDQWIMSMIESKAYNDKIAAGHNITDTEKPAVILREFTDFEIAQTMFTFLFASQDASSSATTWLFQIMAQRPDILDKVRKENLDARGGSREGRIGLEMLESMTYTNAVVKEVLRYRPPVIFVPYTTKKAFRLTPTYTVPKGAMIVPSCYPALHDPEVYPQPDVFDPERWISGNAAEQSKNWLVFAAGPHNCIAQQYVQLTLTAMIGKASLELDWVHHPTSRSEEIKVFATLFPMDDCPMVFTKRQ
ncbi:sterol desaturase [Tricladium varicosporioides]|nr:sterol desaturase [Hymenoscyphus varicosporioides]